MHPTRLLRLIKKGYQKTEVSVNKEANQTSDTAEGTIRMDGENTVDYTNTKTVPSPTGIALEILPFAVLFLAAIAGGVVFSAEKEDDLWSVRQSIV